MHGKYEDETYLISHNPDLRSQKYPANDRGMEWKLNAASIHTESQQKSFRVIYAMFTWVTAISLMFFFSHFVVCHELEDDKPIPGYITKFLCPSLCLWTPMQRDSREQFRLTRDWV